MENKTAKITASNGFAERVYEFNLISAMDGLIIWHEYGSIIISNLDKIMPMFKTFFDVDDGKDGAIFKMAKSEAMATGEKDDEGKEAPSPLLDFISLVPMIVTTPRLLGLCKTMLGGLKVDKDACDEKGECEIFRGDPLEIYAALFWSIVANFPKYMDPLLEALEEGDNDSEEASEGNEYSESQKDGTQGSAKSRKKKKQRR